MACQVLLEFKIADGCHDRLREKIVEILPDTRNFDGCISINFTRDQEDPSKMIVVELWDTRNHYEDYLDWRTVRGDMDMLGEMMKEPSWRFLDLWGV